MMKFFKKKEDFLIRALRLKENGMSLQEILSHFPDNEKEIRGLFETENAISNYFSSIIPSPNLLLSALEILPTEPEKESVANDTSYRYNTPREKMAWFNLKMELSNLVLKKILVPSVVVILLTVGFTTLRNWSKVADNGLTPEKRGGGALEKKVSVATPQYNRETKINLPPEPATDPTAITDAIIALAANEQLEISSYDDETLLSLNAQEIAELNTIYEETDLQ